MAKLPTMTRTHSEVERRIHSALEGHRAQQRDSSKYVRLSGIGKCQRELWAIRQGIPEERPPMGQTLMTFDIGNHVEEAVIEWLRTAGYEILSHAPDGDQWRVEMPGGVGVGHMDGIIQWGHPRNNDNRLLEVKSAKASRFDLLVQSGGYDAWNPQYGDQIQAYMGCSQTEIEMPSLNDSLVIVLCKDDSRIWSEMIRFDQNRFDALVAKADLVMSSDEMVEKDPRANGRYSNYCKWCSRGAWCYSPLTGVKFDD